MNRRYPSPISPSAPSRSAVVDREVDSSMGSAHAKDVYGGRHPSTIPAYTIADAARMLSLPPATVRAWVRGQTVVSRGRRRTFLRVIEADDRLHHRLSFRNLVEIHVLSAIRRAHHVSLPKVRAAVRYLASRMKIDHPLASRRLLTDGRSLLIRASGGSSTHPTPASSRSPRSSPASSPGSTTTRAERRSASTRSSATT